MIIPLDLKNKLLNRSMPRENGCREWHGSLTRRGYGQIMLRGKPHNRPHLTHRLSYLAFRGSIPDGLCVRHTCDNPCCIAPHHLILGSHADNMRDMAVRGRSARGERHGRAILTDVQAIVIRERLAAGESKKAIAAAFGVSISVIQSIGAGRTWKFLGTPPAPPRKLSQSPYAIYKRLYRQRCKEAGALSLAV